MEYKTYRSRDGRLFTADFKERGNQVVAEIWENGSLSCSVGVAVLQPLSDELTKQVPWEALRSEFRWVVMSPGGIWYGATNKPQVNEETIGWLGHVSELTVVNMPRVNINLWRETLCRRPEGR